MPFPDKHTRHIREAMGPEWAADGPRLGLVWADALPGCLSLCGEDPPGKAPKSQVYL